jgi:transcriptional regulator
MSINKELLKGSTGMIVLSLLNRRAMYGYEMIKEIEQRSQNVFSFKEGTLYPILHSLEAEELVESYWEETESQRKRKYYKITEKGRRFYSEKQVEWKKFKTAVEKVLWEGAI